MNAFLEEFEMSITFELRNFHKIHFGFIGTLLQKAPRAYRKKPYDQFAGAAIGPSSSADSYVINVHPNVDIPSHLTVGDSVSNKPSSVTPHRIVGSPGGLGAFDNHDGTFALRMNHEIGAENGITPKHGLAGAFASRWMKARGSARFTPSN
jgi:hypothetical protein